MSDSQSRRCASAFPSQATDTSPVTTTAASRKRKAVDESDGQPVKTGRKKRAPGEKKKPLKNIYAPSPSTLAAAPLTVSPLPDGHQLSASEAFLKQHNDILDAGGVELEDWNSGQHNKRKRKTKRLTKLAEAKEEREKKEAEAATSVATMLAVQRAEAEGALDATDNSEIAGEDDAQNLEFEDVEGIAKSAAPDHGVTGVKLAMSDSTGCGTLGRQVMFTSASQNKTISTVVQSPPGVQKDAERVRDDTGGAGTSEVVNQAAVVDGEEDDGEEDQSQTDDEDGEDDEDEETSQQPQSAQEGHVVYKKPGLGAYAGQRSLKHMLGRKR